MWLISLVQDYHPIVGKLCHLVCCFLFGTVSCGPPPKRTTCHWYILVLYLFCTLLLYTGWNSWANTDIFLTYQSWFCLKPITDYMSKLCCRAVDWLLSNHICSVLDIGVWPTIFKPWDGNLGRAKQRIDKVNCTLFSSVIFNHSTLSCCEILLGVPWSD